MHQEKPDIENYTRVNNDNQTGLYVGVSSNDVCKLPIDVMLSFNYTSTISYHILFQRKSIISLLTILIKKIIICIISLIKMCFR